MRAEKGTWTRERGDLNFQRSRQLTPSPTPSLAAASEKAMANSSPSAPVFDLQPGHWPCSSSQDVPLSCLAFRWRHARCLALHMLGQGQACSPAGLRKAASLANREPSTITDTHPLTTTLTQAHTATQPTTNMVFTRAMAALGLKPSVPPPAKPGE